VCRPEFYKRKLYIAGESKAGQYVPAWGKAMLDHNKDHPATEPSGHIPLSGVLMGNACTDYAMPVTAPLPMHACVMGWPGASLTMHVCMMGWPGA
jgi:carboxypeptidase C (cathepsin A)